MITKVKVSFHYEQDMIIDMVDYNAVKVADMLNNNNVQKVALGDAVVDKGFIRMVKPVDEVTV